MDNPNPQKINLKQIIIIALVVSFLIGGISGLIFGSLAASGNLGSWFTENIIGKTTPKSSFINVNTASVTVQESSATIEAVKKVNPAVVSIVVTKDYSKVYQGSPYSEFFYPFGVPQGQQEIGGGSGFIISEDGLILTNKHVVSDSTAEYTVVLNDGTKYTAKIQAQDPTNDLAFVKVEAKNLPVVELGDSNSIQIGQTAIAIGNVLGEYRNSVTEGIISGLSRDITAGGTTSGSELLYDTIQTDAAINSGNSGGPLVNLAGQVIGVNTAVSQQGQLIGFSIPINQAKKDIESIKNNGKIIRPYLGIRYTIVNKSIQEQNKLSVDYGALLTKGDQGELAVAVDSPAGKAGLVENDIILEFNGVKITEDNTLSTEILKFNPGDQVTLKVLHDGKEKEIKVTLGEWGQ